MITNETLRGADLVLDDPSVPVRESITSFLGMNDEAPGLQGDRKSFGGATGRAGKKREMIWHRHAAYMLAQGRSFAEVAVACDKSINAVRVLFSQVWFRQQIAQIIKEAAGQPEDGALAILSAGAAESALTLVGMATGAIAAPAATRFRAAECVVSRVLGPIGHEKQTNMGSPTQESSTEIESLESEISAIDKQLNEI